MQRSLEVLPTLYEADETAWLEAMALAKRFRSSSALNGIYSMIAGLQIGAV